MKDSTGLELKVMVNEGCLLDCPFRQFHFNAIAHLGKDACRVGEEIAPEAYHERCNKIAFNMFFGHCNTVMEKDPSQVLKSGWVRPEDLGFYDGITSYFKVSGRTVHRNAVEATIRAYMEQSYDGNLLDIVDSSLKAFGLSHGAVLDNKSLGEAGFMDLVTSCDRSCEKCSACDAIAQRALSFESAAE